jgi:uncharacterized protein (TIGR02145 family)
MKYIINRKVFIFAFHAIVLLIFLLPTMQSCKKLDFEKVVRIKTGEISSNTKNSATIIGFIQDIGKDGITQYGHCWSIYMEPTIDFGTKTVYGFRNNIGSFQSDLTDLVPDVTYYVRAYATSSQGTVYGDEVDFSTTHETGTFIDSRDGHTYKYVHIDNQIWMAENLAYLPYVYPPSEASVAEPYYYVYGYNGTSVSDAKTTTNYKTYGVLYNWPAAMDGAGSSDANPSGIQGVCPTGWHLPSDAEWKELEINLGMSKSDADSTSELRGTDEGSKLKEVGNEHWLDDNEDATNSSGFTGLPGGFHTAYEGTFYTIGYEGDWWSSTEFSYWDAWYRCLYFYWSTVFRGTCSKSDGQSVRCVKDTAYAAPVAAFTASTTTITAGQSVQFTDQSTNSPISWNWDFGDEGTSTGQNPSHTYMTGGTYTVRLTVTNSYGSDTITKTDYITVNAPGNPPFAAFTASPTTITTGEAVNFTDQSANNPTSWSWDFGDGGTSTDQNPSHNYLTAGTFTVILTATNGDGSDSETKSDYIVVEDAGETFTDSRDGKTYKWVQIGDQVWMAENLAYLPSVSPPTQESRSEPYYYVYGYWGYSLSEAKALANYSVYGTLYNWAAAMDGAASSNSNPSGVQGVCPSGWHLPSEAEWDELTDFLGGESVAGGKLKETGYDHWQEPNEDATNSSGFSALPGGAHYYNSSFDMINKFGKYWSGTEASISYAWPRLLHYSEAAIFRESTFKEDGLSVRCVKN